MKSLANQFRRVPTGRPGFVSVWLFSGAFLGLLIGLFEASLLWTTPRVIPLLVPDVGWVVWFLAPLVDMTFFALVGFGLGLLAGWTRHKEVFVAANGGVAITFIYLMVKWFHVEIGLHPFYPAMELLVPLMTLAAGFTVSLVVLAFAWPWLVGFADRWLNNLRKPLARGLAGVTVTAVVGVGIFAMWPPTSGPAAPTAAQPPSAAPNIVFITLDTVRADHLSSYGYWRHTTPNIDRFARTGVLFENAIAPSSWTLASHASLFTGLLPQQHGADWTVPISSSPSTLAEVLRSQGYQTAGVVANFHYLERGWGIAQGFETYNDNSSYLSHSLAETLLGKAVLQPLFQSFLSYESFDRRNAQEINRGVYEWYRHRSHRPYFLFVNFLDAHDPYITEGFYNHRFGKMPVGLVMKLHFAAENAASWYSFSSRERKLGLDGYDNCLAYLDRQVGRLLKFLRQSSDWQNTIVIITSDHGEEFGGHGSYQHGRNLYREVLHVPLIISGPGVPMDMRVSHLVGTRELFSTVLDLAGRGHTPFSHTSLARFWKPGFKPTPADNAVVSEDVPLWSGDGGPVISLTTPEWQYIEHRDGRQELYNWAADSKEKGNLAAAPGEQATLEGLHSHLVKLVSDATGPWHGMPYLQALDTVKGPARLSLLHPRSLQQDMKDDSCPVGIAQAFFNPEKSMPIPRTHSERDLMRRLPYQ